MKIEKVTFDTDSQGNIQILNNRVNFYLHTEKGGTVLLFCKIEPNEHTINSYHVSFEGLWCPCCNTRNTSHCSSLDSKKYPLLQETYEILMRDPKVRPQIENLQVVDHN